jgi:hypothetical protein
LAQQAGDLQAQGYKGVGLTPAGVKTQVLKTTQISLDHKKIAPKTLKCLQEHPEHPRNQTLQAWLPEGFLRQVSLSLHPVG